MCIYFYIRVHYCMLLFYNNLAARNSKGSPPTIYFC
jgi:hypothetical protein